MWDSKDLLFNEEIANTMSCTRWHEIERNLKLCKNDLDRTYCGSPNSGNVAYKFDYIYETIINNTNCFTEWAGLDLCINDSTS